MIDWLIESVNISAFKLLIRFVSKYFELHLVNSVMSGIHASHSAPFDSPTYQGRTAANGNIRKGCDINTHII